MTDSLSTDNTNVSISPELAQAYLDRLEDGMTAGKWLRACGLKPSQRFYQITRYLRCTGLLSVQGKPGHFRYYREVKA